MCEKILVVESDDPWEESFGRYKKKGKVRRMELITVHVPQRWITKIEEMVEDGEFANRSEYIRYCVRLEFDRSGRRL